jgi:signal transduction histidine kinase
MKPLIRLLIAVTAVFALLFGCFALLYGGRVQAQTHAYHITTNRIADALQALLQDESIAPEAALSAHEAEWRSAFGADSPEQIRFLSAVDRAQPIFLSADKNTAACTVRNADGTLCGFLFCTYPDRSTNTVLRLGCLLIAVCWLLITGAVLYIYFRMLAPFRRLSEYPARIARIPTAEKLPESKDRWFGKYIWGMNMLHDTLQAERRHIGQMEARHRKMLASIAHGVKTPLTNIRLYADAIGTGLYGTGPESAQQIAEKITANADKIGQLTSELIETASTSASSYEPEYGTFYLRELAALTKQEFAARMELNRIPFSVECESNPLVRSDLYGLFRIITQLLSNAEKYGDGSGISVVLNRQDEGFAIIVRNRGVLLPESELPFIFGSYWRGSNAQNTEGSGIGLYISQQIASALGGTIFARRLPESGEMEFTAFFESL